MHRSSETIGKIAAALAIAQRQLQNPGKSQTATLPGTTERDPSRSFRYASLATGLDIIRRTLGEHEIAVVQSTSLDRELRLIRLATVLAHSSGEWIGSDWPVCTTAEVSTPHRLGAALTYARRYALFTIVGIAGEDDLDAPDLIHPSSPKPTRSTSKQVVPVTPDRSKLLRDQLLAELLPLTALDDLTIWAVRRLNAKNQLLSDDAEQVDHAYLAKLSRTGLHGAGDAGVSTETLSQAQSVISLPKTVRRRSKGHLAFVAAKPCMICKRSPCDAHHLKFAQPRALGRKVSDEFTVPLCREHHTELHRHRNERAWWANAGLAPLDVAAELWDESQRQEAIDRGSSNAIGKLA